MADVTNTPQTDTALLTVTPLALDKIRELLDTRGTPDSALRLFVQGGGCSGVSYGMAFETNEYPQDTVIEQDGIKLVIDPNSLDFLRGVVIDYIDDARGSGFAIENPNAAPESSCACGGSCGCGGH